MEWTAEEKEFLESHEKEIQDLPNPVVIFNRFNHWLGQRVGGKDEDSAIKLFFCLAIIENIEITIVASKVRYNKEGYTSAPMADGILLEDGDFMYFDHPPTKKEILDKYEGYLFFVFKDREFTEKAMSTIKKVEIWPC